MFNPISLFGMLGNFFAGLVYIAPSNVFWDIVKRRSTGDYESIPYISKLLNALFWVYYGVIKPDVIIASINIFGAFVEILFLAIFLIFAPSRMRTRTAILVAIMDVSFPAAAILFTQFFLGQDVRIHISGFLSSAFSVIAFASPLSAMKTVILTKSVEYMPFLLSLVLFINAVVWTVYAALAEDVYVAVPNVLGLLLGAAQLILYAMYWKPKSSEDSEDQHNKQPFLA